MKKLTLLVAICTLALTSNAQNNENQALSEVEATSTQEVKRDLVALTNGVEMYYSTTDVSGNVLLNIHFVNTSEEPTTFTWAITQEDRSFQSEKEITLKPGKSFDQKAALEVKGTSDLSGYSIELTFK